MKPTAESRSLADRHYPDGLNAGERFLNLFTTIAPGEGRAIALFSLYGFLVVGSFYIFKTVREPLLLTANSAVAKSNATAMAAIILFLLMPVYSLLFKRLKRRHLLAVLAIIFSASGAAFIPLLRAGYDIGYPYYIWTAVYGVAMIAHFWAFATSALNVESGNRLFPLFLAAASLGGIAGAELTSALLDKSGIESLLGLGSLLLLATIALPTRAGRSLPAASRNPLPAVPENGRLQPIGGLGLVICNRYLLTIAAYVVILNIVNTTGEYVLAESIVQRVDAATSDAVARQLMIGRYYARYTVWITMLGFILQLFVVSRLFRRYGPGTASMILPVLALAGYALAGVFPVFTLIYLFKVIENGVDYSIMNTTRHAWFLPAGYREKFEGKSTIDTLFWRIGDLLQVLIIHLGSQVLGWGIAGFSLFNALLAALWILFARQVSNGYRTRLAAGTSSPPDQGKRRHPVRSGRLALSRPQHEIAPTNTIAPRRSASTAAAGSCD